MAALLSSQSSGVPTPADQQDPSAGVTANLQGAMGRRFGQNQDFDPTYDAGLRSLMGQVPQLQSNYESQRQRAGEDFTTAADQLAKTNDDQNTHHLQNMADNGLGYSGANLIGQERIGTAFQKGVQGAGTAYTRGLENLSSSEAAAYKNIESRRTDLEGAAAERARVRDETAAWQKQQLAMETQRQQQEQKNQETALAAQQAQQAQFDQQLKAMEAQALVQSQPMATPTGSYSSGGSYGGGGGGGGGGAPAASAPAIDTNSNISVNYEEYNLRDPNEVKQLQYSLGLRPDGIVGPATAAALQQQNAVSFDDRPINTQSRTERNWGKMYTYPGAPNNPAPSNTSRPGDPQVLGGGYFGRSGR